MSASLFGMLSLLLDPTQGWAAGSPTCNAALAEASPMCGGVCPPTSMSCAVSVLETAAGATVTVTPSTSSLAGILLVAEDGTQTRAGSFALLPNTQYKTGCGGDAEASVTQSKVLYLSYL